MRTRRTLSLALVAGVALTLVATQPAVAASRTWTAPGDAWWSAAAWTGGAPLAGDDVTFAGGPRSTYDYPTTTFGSFTFLATHEIANGGGAIALTGGMQVAAPAVARIQPQLTASGSQTWSVASGAELQLPSLVMTDGTNPLELAIDGTMTVEATGNLDALSSGCIVKSGAGVLRLLGGGGGVGACPGQPQGLDVTAGEVAIVGTPNLGGKDLAVTGGVLTGGTASGAAVVRQLNLAGTGVVSPGPSSGSGIGELSLWGTSAWTGGTYQVDWDAAAGDADYVAGAGQALSVTGTRLDVRLAGTPGAGDTVRIAGSDVAFSGQFSSPTGTPLADGDEFTSNGQVYSLSYVTGGAGAGAVLQWLRAAPVVEPPVTPTGPVDPELAATGAEQVVPLAVAGILAIGVGAAALLVSGRRRRPVGIR